MPLEIEGAPSGWPPRRWARVAAIETITPRVRRLRLQGEDLTGFELPNPGGHVKLILPAAGESRPAVPLRYEGRTAIWAEGAQQPFLRTYTPLHFDPDRLELEVDLLVHGEGMASGWVQRAQVGDEVLVAGPRGGWAAPQDGAWYVVAADETAIPAAEQVLAALPDASVTVLFEVADAAEERSIPGTEGHDVRWLHRGNATPGVPLETALRDLDLPGAPGYAWVACEAGAMRRIRAHLLHDREMASDHVVTRGYWKLGAADHPDGDYGQDDLGHGH